MKTERKREKKGRGEGGGIGVWDKKEGRKTWYIAILSPFLFKIMLEVFSGTIDNQINKAHT